MGIRLNNFVEVNITHRPVTLTPGVFDTALYVNATATPGYLINASGTAPAHENKGSKNYPYYLGDVEVAAHDEVPAVLYEDDPYISTFFANGGKYLHIVPDIKYDATAAAEWIYEITESGATATYEIPANEIVVFANTSATPTNWNKVIDGPNQKIFLNGSATTTSGDKTEGSGLVYRYSGSTQYGLAAIAAYFTQINMSQANSCKDYAFTAQAEIPAAEVIDTNTAVAACIANNLNCTIYLAGQNRNIGGDDYNGNNAEPITNLFMRIALQQTLQDALVNLLVTKLPLNASGIAKVINTISYRLNMYITNGYIDTTKVWTEPDLYIDNQLVIAQGNPLTGGYTIHVSPITAADRTSRKLPNIYIVFGDQIGVRKIVVNGEVF